MSNLIDIMAVVDGDGEWTDRYMSYMETQFKYPWITEAVELNYQLTLPRDCVYAWVWSNFPEMVKVGYTTRGRDRWRKSAPVPTDYPGAVLPDLGERVFIAALPTPKPRAVEQMAHSLLAPYRNGGEWFSVSPEHVIEVLRDLDAIMRKYQEA